MFQFWSAHRSKKPWHQTKERRAIVERPQEGIELLVPFIQGPIAAMIIGKGNLSPTFAPLNLNPGYFSSVTLFFKH